MESTTYLVSQLAGSQLTTPSGQIISFKPGDDFRWDPTSLCIFYNPTAFGAPQLLLHELGHALLGHANYTYDIELLRMERAAWDKAIAICGNYKININEDLLEQHLNTYRDWLHNRSLCPSCNFTGLQTGHLAYYCPACHATWRVNQARTCELRRYLTK